MLSLILACGLFFGIHVFVSGTTLRDGLVRAVGERAYLGGFSLVSLGALVWMSIAYGGAPYAEVWPPQVGLVHANLALSALATLLVVLGLTTPNPTSAGQAGALHQAHAAHGIVKVTRHPFLWGVALWALGHMLANGDAASLVLFGTLLLLSLVGPFLIDAKRARKDPDGWARFSAETSWLPFAAMAAGRTKLALGELGWWRIAVAVVVYVVIVMWLHALVIGVSPLPS